MDEKPTEMKASDEILSKKELIKQILTNFPETRDCDRKCCVRIWEKETGRDSNAFLYYYEQGDYTSADSISRLKRLIQKEHPELRGIDKSDEEEKCRLVFSKDLFDDSISVPNKFK